jgi:hypothetical protein
MEKQLVPYLSFFPSWDTPLCHLLSSEPPGTQKRRGTELSSITLFHELMSIIRARNLACRRSLELTLEIRRIDN